MHNFICSICGNVAGNASFVAQEMMFGLREKFLYFKCLECGCLQIGKPPENMQPYYPPGKYYSLALPRSNENLRSVVGLFFRKIFLAVHFKGNGHRNRLTRLLFRNKEYRWITELRGLKFNSSILDVGSGMGALLIELNRLGFTNLTGIDPFIDKDCYYSETLRVLKGNVGDVGVKQYDLVMLNHVFEHLDRPHDVFEQLSGLLSPDGHLLIRLPVVDCYCWRKYGVFWFQLDAPRHFFLHTVKSMSVLAETHRLDLISVHYDSDESQFYNSEKYLRDISLFSRFNVNKRILSVWKKHAQRLNTINDGDQACFIFSRKSSA